MPLDSSNNGYNPTPQLQQVLASPDIQGTRQRDDVNNSKSYQLAKQLGALQPEIQNIQGDIAQSDKERATGVVNSMTPEDLAVKIKEGDMHVTGSPVFNAVVAKQNASNIAYRSQLAITQKIASGEYGQQFSDDSETTRWDAQGKQNPNWISGNQKLDAYLNGVRNGDLKDMADNRYAIAGYDNHWQTFVQSAQEANTAVLTHQSEAFGAGVYRTAVSNLENNPNLSPAEFAAQFTKLNATTTLPSGSLVPQKQRAIVYGEVAQKLSYAGDTAKMEAFFKVPLDNGLTVAEALGKDQFGDKLADKYMHTAQLAQERNDAKAAVVAKHVELKANTDKVLGDISSLLLTGRGSSVPARIPMPQLDGGFKMENSDTVIYDQQVAITKGMMPEQRQTSFIGNGIIDKDVQNIIAAGINSGVNDTGTVLSTGEKKVAGQVTPEFRKSFDTWTGLIERGNGLAISGQYTPKELQQTFLGMRGLIKSQGYSVDGAAAIASLVDTAADDQRQKWTNQANSVVNAMNPSWITRLVTGEYAVTDNLPQAQEMVRKSSIMLFAAGLSEKEITKANEQYVKDNFANIQGTLIPRSNLPAVGREDEVTGGAESELSSYNDAMIMKLATIKGISPSSIKMMPSFDGSVYHWTAGGQFLQMGEKGTIFTQTQDHVKQYITENMDNIRLDQIHEYNRKAFISSLEQSDVNLDGYAFGKNPNADAEFYLSSKAGFRALHEAGLTRNYATPKVSMGKVSKEQQALNESYFGKPDVRTPMDRLLGRGDAGTQGTRLSDSELYNKQIEFAKDKLSNGASWTDSGTKVHEDFPDLRGLEADPAKQDQSTWDKRKDGSVKGNGFLGVLKRSDGRVSTEISISTSVLGGKDFPLLVPTLTRQEIEKILALPENSKDPEKDFWSKLPKGVIKKAEDFAIRRNKEGRPLFALPSESPTFQGGKQ